MECVKNNIDNPNDLLKDFCVSLRNANGSNGIDCERWCMQVLHVLAMEFYSKTRAKYNLIFHR